LALPTTGLAVTIFGFGAVTTGCVVSVPGVGVRVTKTATGAAGGVTLGFFPTAGGGAFVVIL
jgi:hypothetical protein